MLKMIFNILLQKYCNNNYKMVAFSLYTSLLSQIDTETLEKNLSEVEKKCIVDFIKKSNTEVHELIYMLIKTHHLKNNDVSTTNLPFCGKEQKAGLKFEFDMLPVPLQNILYKFSTLNPNS